MKRNKALWERRIIDWYM